MSYTDLVPRELIGVSHLVILVTGLLANALVIFILAVTRADRLQWDVVFIILLIISTILVLRKPNISYNYFVINLAVADFLHLLSLINGIEGHFMPITEVRITEVTC